MDDLSGLDWSNTSQPAKPPPMSNTSSAFYPSLRPTPSPLTSGRNTPLSSQASGNANAKPPAPKVAPDSFSNLVNFGSAKSNANLSLREQQERLVAEKRRKEEERRKQAQAAYGDGQFWDTLGQRSTGASRTASPAIQPPTAVHRVVQNGKTESDDDLFAAFRADTKVDNASHFPPPSQPPLSGKSTPANAPTLDLSNPSAWGKPAASSGGGFADDDDPFGLNQLQLKSSTSKPQPAAAQAEDDDFLGDLGKPVEEVRRKNKIPERRAPDPEPGKPIEDSDSDSADEQEARAKINDPFDKAVAQLVDWGFTPENARRGLTESGAGLNVQAAVNWLLDDAHRQAKEKARGKKPGAPDAGDNAASSRHGNASPAWATEDGSNRRGNRSPAGGDDLAKAAAAMGTSFLKTANSLWKTGQKKVQQAVAEFQHEPDPSQPRWMRSAHEEDAAAERQQRGVTDEALLLESGARPERTHGRPAQHAHAAQPGRTDSRDQSPAMSASSTGRSNAAPKGQPPRQPSFLDPRARLSKQAIEEQSSQAYVSPARRKKTTPQPPTEPRERLSEEPNLLFDSQAPSQSKPSLSHRSSQPSPAGAGAPSRPQPQPSRPAPTPRPARQIPPITPAVLAASTRHRQDGTSHFKRGDYAAAHTCYTSSLESVPQEHPLRILLLCNRALTALKTGEPRQAVGDADAAIELIGPSKGEGEFVHLQDQTGERRDMKGLYGKALTRKAEALEQMEKWGDASAVWQLCVESGVGGPTAIAGRQRCQKALAPKPAAKPPTPAARPGASTPAARPRPAAPPGPKKDSEAVEKLRAANEAAAKADEEKFALADKIDARVAAWRDGKRDNLRALLGSLDQVLWENSGWKKVGLHELVVANKVKIAYMKAIAKTHPDKLPQDASTEVRMIAAIVFATLNESWDKFKAENGM